MFVRLMILLTALQQRNLMVNPAVQVQNALRDIVPTKYAARRDIAGLMEPATAKAKVQPFQESQRLATVATGRLLAAQVPPVAVQAGENPANMKTHSTITAVEVSG